MIGEVTALSMAARVAVEIRRSQPDQRGQAIDNVFEKLMLSAGNAWPDKPFNEAMSTISDILCTAIDLADRPPLEPQVGRA